MNTGFNYNALQAKFMMLFVLILPGILVSLIGVVQLVQTVPHAEYSRATEWYPCGKKANGRGGLDKFIVAISLVFRSQDIMASVVQIMVHLALSVLWNLCMLSESHKTKYSPDI